MTHYKIGDIAKLLGLSTQALRFYEQESVIIPQKSENGTRFFSVSDVIRLLGFKKYKLSEFSVQDVASHFKQGTLQSLVDQLGAHSDALIAQSEMLLKRARAIRRFERSLRDAQAHTDEISVVTRPEFYLYAPPFDQLNRIDDDQRAAFMAFTDAMPDTSMCFTCNASLDHPQFRFCAQKKDIDAWSLPQNELIVCPSVRCVRIHQRICGQPWDYPYLSKTIQLVREAGYTVHPDEQIFGVHLASETIDRAIYLYGTMYIPVL